MAMIDVVRTTAFRLAPEHFGRVFVYRPGPRFTRAWEQTEQKRRLDGQRWMPHGGLAIALRVLSRDFVAVQRRVAGDRVFVISRQRIASSDLAIAVGAWEQHSLNRDDEPISAVLDDIVCEEVDVFGLVQRRAGRCPTIGEGAGWVWDVAIWELAHRLAAEPLSTEMASARLRLDSDAALLTWDNLVRPADANAAAMHKIVLHLVTVPGVEEPVISLQSSLVRLAPSWRETGGAKFAWADIDADAPLVRGRVRTRRDPEGFKTFWDDGAAEVLRGASFLPLPSTDEEPTVDGAVRTGYARQPSSHRIGRGVGTWFHECVAQHARRAFGSGASCLELAATSRATWPTRKTVASRPSLAFDQADPTRKLRLLVIYANSSVRRRVRDALTHVLADGAHSDDESGIASLAEKLRGLADGETLAHGPIEVRFMRPPDAEAWMLTRNSDSAIDAWLRTWLPQATAGAGAAIVETDEAAADRRDDLADPKHLIRAQLARHGVVSQFITERSAPSPAARRRRGGGDVPRDHGAYHAVGDLLRSAGFFLRPFPAFGSQPGTLVVGVYGARPTRKTTGGKASHITNVVAVSLGTHDAWGYVERTGWAPLDQATAWFLGNEQALSDSEARQRVERAIGQLPLALGSRPTIVLFDAAGCRRFWPWLTDKSDGVVDPWVKQGGAAVVRVRTTTSEVPRPAGAGGWDEGLRPARHTDFRPMTVAAAQGLSPTFVLSGSAVMSQGQSARKSTRFATSPRGLREDWHSLGTTELLVLEPGAWKPDDLVAQVAMLCRVAPTWDRTLRWPSPLHLARAVVRDHPHGYAADGDDAEETEDARQMRFDLGGF